MNLLVIILLKCNIQFINLNNYERIWNLEEIFENGRVDNEDIEINYGDYGELEDYVGDKIIFIGFYFCLIEN